MYTKPMYVEWEGELRQQFMETYKMTLTEGLCMNK